MTDANTIQQQDYAAALSDGWIRNIPINTRSSVADKPSDGQTESANGTELSTDMPGWVKPG